MREIKFRAWDKKNNKMITRVDEYDEIFLPIIYGEEENYNAMQFVGLKDKNGREIYEGDIVSLDSWNPSNMQICFIEGAFCLANEDGEYVGDIHYIHHAGIEQSEVIGNIYQNPELLK